MKTSNKILLSSIIGLILFCAVIGVITLRYQIVSAPKIIGDGIGQTLTYALPDVSSIIIKGTYNVIIDVCDNNSELEVTGDRNIISKLKYEVRGRMLTIPKVPYSSDNTVKIRISVKKIEAISVVGMCYVKANIPFVNKLTVDAGGTYKIILHGNVGKFEFNGAGMGSIEAKDLKSENVELNIAGMIGADISASKKIEINMVGMGKVTYLGNPIFVDRNILGMVNVVGIK